MRLLYYYYYQPTTLMIRQFAKRTSFIARATTTLRTCSKEASSSPTETTPSPTDSLHSTDIAFKPNKDGWGSTKGYTSSYERIFGKKKRDKTSSDNSEQESSDGVVTKLTFKTRQ